MTVTDTPPIATDRSVETGVSTPSLLVRIADVITTGEHKIIGRMYLLSSLGFAVFTLVIGVLVGLEQVDMSGLDIVGGSEAYLQLFFLWRTGLVFLVVVPLFLGLATSIVPLQVGAPSIAFPRAAAAAFWGWLLASGLYIGATMADGGFNAGGDSDAIELTILAMGMMIASLLLATVCVMTTVIAQRTEGMSLLRVPMFSWSMLAAGAIWLVTFPVLLALLVLSWADLRGDVVVFFETGSGAPGSLRYLAWAFDYPQVFVYAVPLLGILAEMVPVTAGRRQTMRSVMMGAIAAFAFLSFGAYAQPVFNARVAQQPVFVVQNLLLLLPLLVLLGGWAFTLVSGRPKASVSVGVAGGGLLMLLAGGGVATIRVFGRLVGGLRELGDWSWVDDISAPFDDLADTAAVAAEFRYVVLAGLIGAVAGIHFWAPKLFGRRLSPALGGLAGLALVGGTVLASLSEVVNGFLDEPDIATNVAVDSGVETLNWVAAVGLAVVALGVLTVLGDLVLAGLRGTRDLDDNPVGGHTLEWATSSPPPHNNFATAIVVTSAEPLLDDEGGEV
jgi:heme/copper-type cytochrome/quinol oxidase subunit 1